jgi:hypothetical protein
MQKIDGIGTEAFAKDPASQTPIVRVQLEIRPCVDIRINLRQVLDRETLEQDPFFRGERLAKRLFLPSNEKVLDPSTTVYLRIQPQSDHVIYELVDPLASDLKRCDYLFSRIIGLQNCSGILEELAAPSFSGKQAIAVVRNVMALGNLDELQFADGAIRLPCCPPGCLTSLRLAGAFCNGKSWYEEQGAVPKISTKLFQWLALEDFYEATSHQIGEDSAISETKTSRPSHYERLFLENDPDTRITKTKDLDRIAFEQCSRMQKEWQPSKKAYSKATHFLHEIQITEISDCLLRLSSKYSQLYPLYEALRESFHLGIVSEKRLGTIISELMKTKESSSHKLLHEVIERLIADKDSIFFQYIADTFEVSKDISDTSLMLAFCVLNTFFHDLEGSLTKARPILYKLLKANDSKRLLLAKEIGPLREKKQAQILEALDGCTEISFVKVCSHSTKLQQERYWHYMHEIGTTDEFLTAQRAIQCISRQPLQQLQSVYKKLSDVLMKRFHLTEMDLLNGITIENLMDSSGPTGQAWILDELLCGSLKHLSALLVQHFDKQTEKSPVSNELYELFMICKYTVRNRELFTLGKTS